MKFPLKSPLLLAVLAAVAVYIGASLPGSIHII